MRTTARGRRCGRSHATAAANVAPVDAAARGRPWRRRDGRGGRRRARGRGAGGGVSGGSAGSVAADEGHATRPRRSARPRGRTARGPPRAARDVAADEATVGVGGAGAAAVDGLWYDHRGVHRGCRLRERGRRGGRGAESGSRRRRRSHGMAAEEVASVDATGGRGRTDSGQGGCRCSPCTRPPGEGGGGAGGKRSPSPPTRPRDDGGGRRFGACGRSWGGRRSGGPPPWTRPRDDRGGPGVDAVARDGRTTAGCVARKEAGRLRGRGHGTTAEVVASVDVAARDCCGGHRTERIRRLDGWIEIAQAAP